jgi:AraC-like DNA-binding protein
MLPPSAPGGKETTVSDAFETTDAGLAEQRMRDGYGGLRFSPRGQRGGMRLEQAPLTPSARLDHLTLKRTVDIQAGPLGVLAIGHVRSGRVAYRSDGSERPYGPGDVSLCAQPEHFYMARCTWLDTDIAVLDPALLSRIASTAPARAPRPVRLTGYDPVSASAAQAWIGTCAYIRDTILAFPGTAAQPLLAASAEQLLAATALATFPHNALADPTIEDRRDAHPATLRRATTFIDEHAQEDITIADIAAAASVTTRAVQLAFRRHLDTTPMAYLRRVRLGHAHLELLAADPARLTVTAIAYRWGFPSASRFAAQYRAAYGTPPSRALHS